MHKSDDFNTLKTSICPHNFYHIKVFLLIYVLTKHVSELSKEKTYPS